MPSLPPERFAPLSALGLGEKDAWLYETRRHDGLAPVQIVRRWGGPGHGLPETAMAALSARLDLSADADLEPTVLLPALGGAGAYVANPRVEGVPHPGLWRGGPILVQFDRQSIPKDRFLFLEQTLTMVHHAGEWSVGEDGAPVLAAAAPATVPHVRPALRDTRSPDAPLVADWTGSSGEVEATIRDWTEESRDALLAATPEQLGLPAGWSAAERRFETDPETGTGVLVLKGVRRTVWSISSATDLERADHRLEPARRETIRNWGLGSPRSGAANAARGFAWTCAAEWANVSRASWNNLLRIDTDALGASLLGSSPAWRTLLAEILPQEDGLLGYRVTWQRPDLDAANRATVQTGTRDAGGWGAHDEALVPTVPLADAPARAAALAAPEGSVLGEVRVEEREGGAHADIRVETERGWDYASRTPPNLPSVSGISAPLVEWRPGAWAGAGGYRVLYRNVLPSAVPRVAEMARAAATPSGTGALLTALRVEQSGGGLCDVEAVSSALRARASGAVLLTADKFSETWRERFDGLADSGSGSWTWADDGSAAAVTDALGNRIELAPHAVDGEGRRAAFAPGRIVTVRMDRGERCWSATVDTEIAIPAEWEWEWETQRAGHPALELVHEWRNAPEMRTRSAAHGRSVDTRDEINRFGLHDGRWADGPDIHEERRETVSDDALARTTRTDTMHTSGAAAGAAAAPGEAVQRTVTTHSDGAQDVSETREAAKPASAVLKYTVKRGGHDVNVREERYSNAAAPRTPSGTRAGSASAQRNRFDRFDGSVEEQDDIRELRRVTESDDALTHTRRVDVLVDGGGDASARAAPGTAVTKAVTEYSDGKHDTSETVEEAKQQTTQMQWGEKRAGHDIQVRQTETRNGASAPSVSAGANERVSVSAQRNRFDRIDSTVRAETDVYVKRRTRRTESPALSSETVEEIAAARAPARPRAAQGSVVETSDDEYSDGLHDASTTTRTAKPQAWTWTWQHRYRDTMRGGEATAYGYGYSNQKAVQHPSPPSSSSIGYAGSASWTKNEYGLFDGTVVFKPVFKGRWRVVKARQRPIS